MKVGALIPARIGSKRLPRKNIIDLGGKPLICWTIDTLLEADVFDRITVSTESEDVSEVVRSFYGSKVSILKRPEELAGDDSSLEDVQQHYLDSNPDIEWFGLFMPTYPFRKIERLHDAVRQIYSGYPWRVQTVTASENCSLDYCYPVKGGVNRFYHMQPFYATNNISTYIFFNRHTIDSMWTHYGLTMHERCYKIYADLHECVDIDTKEDFELAKKIADGGTLYLKKPILTEYGDWTIQIPEGVDLDGMISFISEEVLENLDTPLLALNEVKLHLTTFRIHDGHHRSYWYNDEAIKYLADERVKKTGNNAYLNKHYIHSSHYRFLRNVDKDPSFRPAKESDKHGIIYGGLGTISRLAENKRILFLDEVKDQEWYVDPVAITHPREI